MGVAFFQTLKDTIFPLSCVTCARNGHLLCQVCRADFALRERQQCPACEVVTAYGAACSKHRDTALAGVVALGWYAQPALQRLIRLWKYEYVRAAEPVFETLLARWLGGAPAIPTASWVVVPVPLHPMRARQRGFNQAAVLAHLVAQELGVPIQIDVLTRTRMSITPQAEMTDRDKRAKRGMGAFVVKKRVPTHVLLVDDVFTTGATMQACASALVGAGAEVVWGCVLARGD